MSLNPVIPVPLANTMLAPEVKVLVAAAHTSVAEMSLNPVIPVPLAKTMLAPEVKVLVPTAHTPASVALDDTVAFKLSTISFPTEPTVVSPLVRALQMFPTAVAVREPTLPTRFPPTFPVTEATEPPTFPTTLATEPPTFPVTEPTDPETETTVLIAPEPLTAIWFAPEPVVGKAPREPVATLGMAVSPRFVAAA